MLASTTLLAIIGCAKNDPVTVASSGALTPPNPAEVMIKKSMDMYKNLNGFSTKCSWNATVGPDTVKAERTLHYEAPNRYEAVAKANSGKINVTMTSISDGKKVLETSTNAPGSALGSPAPPTIADTSSMLMQSQFAEGSLLYKFFAGSGAYEGLVDTSKGPAGFGNEVKEPKETAKQVKFYGTGMYGHVTAVIGEKTGEVYEISYDSEPITQRAAQAGKTIKANAVEKYNQIELNPTAKVAFVTTPAKGVKLMDANAPAPQESKTAVAIGAKAPTFKVIPVNGGAPVSLASLRGKPVLIDFWATWCGPCKMSLPHTQAIYDDLKSKGLQVLVVSDEEIPKIKAFVSQNKYTFPVYQDPGNAAEAAFGVNAIPRMLIIDKDGKVQSDFVGLQDESTLRDALKKVGVS